MPLRTKPGWEYQYVQQTTEVISMDEEISAVEDGVAAMAEGERMQQERNC